MRDAGAQGDRVAGLGRAGGREGDDPAARDRQSGDGIRICERTAAGHRGHREGAVVTRDRDTADDYAVANLQRVSVSHCDRDRVAVFFGAAARSRARRGIDRHRERLDRGGLRITESEGDDLDFVAAAVVAQRPGLHLVDRRLDARGIGGDFLEAALREIRVAVRLQVVGQADAGVGHDR